MEKILNIHTSSRKEYNQLMKIMEENKWVWEDGELPNDYNGYTDYREETTIEFNNKFRFGNVQSCLDGNESVVEFKDWILTRSQKKATKKEFPEYFAIERDPTNPLWNEYVSWLNKENPQRKLNGESQFYGNRSGDSAYVKECLSPDSVIISLEDWAKEMNISIPKKPVLTYETIKERSDGVVFKKDSIDGKTIISLQEERKQFMEKANNIQKLLNAHSKIKF